MAAWARFLVKALVLVPSVFVAAASPLWGSLLLAAPVAFGVLSCTHRAVKAARRDGWLAEI